MNMQTLHVSIKVKVDLFPKVTYGYHFSEFKLMKIIDELQFYEIDIISKYFEAALLYVRVNNSKLVMSIGS